MKLIDDFMEKKTQDALKKENEQILRKARLSELESKSKQKKRMLLHPLKTVDERKEINNLKKEIEAYENEKKDRTAIIALCGLAAACMLMLCISGLFSKSSNDNTNDNEATSAATEVTAAVDSNESENESKIGDNVASNSSQNEEVANESISTDRTTEESKTEKPEENELAQNTEGQGENKSPVPAKKRSNYDLKYDSDGYIIAEYALRKELANKDKPNVHLTGTLVDTNNICFTIKDKGGNLWTGGSAGGRDFTEYIGTECDIYGFCSGGTSSSYNTPYIDMAYNDSHISFEDGRSYYPKDNESYAQFPSWDFENENEGSGSSVWIPTEGGTKYHSYEGCSGMENPEQVTEEEAIRRGFDRCGKCW